jgi:hypothetical protein
MNQKIQEIIKAKQSADAERTFEKLVKNLEELTKNYRHLLELVRSERDVLKESNIQKLNELNQNKENLIQSIQSLDALRVNYATDLAQAVGADTAQPRLLEIAQKLGGPSGDRLRNIHSALELLLSRLFEINRNNAKAAELALNNVNKSLDSFKENLMGQKTYQNKGQYQTGPEKSGHLVSREA